ncbi:MAG: NFACT RNA binding domain-containing protein, partial [bacterium]
YGNTILQNLQQIKRGDKKYLYEHEDGQKIEIKLKDNLTPVENAQNYFDKYKKQKSSVDLLRSKIHSMEKEKRMIEDELQKINNLNDYKTLIKEEKKSGENKNDETSRFRKFKLNEKYEVWVGKDSASNDLLTTRHSAQNDLWFHVRGSSGSHTVLKVSNKKEDIPKEAIQSAASIAAYYSKARKASSVPVAYCERKFVKKKKGFKEGSVVMEREKVIFVKPSLPEEN